MATVAKSPRSLLERAAARAATDPFFLGSALAVYRSGEGLDGAALARRLGCSADTLPRLALCRRPVSSDPAFAADVRRIATWAGVDPDELANVLRYAESIEALWERRRSSASGQGTLLAARDRDEAGPDAGPDA